MKNENKYYCLESEKNIIASMILDPDSILQIEAGMKDYFFYNSTYKELYNIILKMSMEKIAINQVSVLNYSKYDVELIDSILRNFVTSAAIKDLIKIVKDKYKYRDLLISLKKINQKIDNFNHFDSIDDLIIACKSSIDIKFEEKRNEKFSHYIDYVKNSIGKEKEKNIGYGIPWLDSFTFGTHKQQVTILAARPSLGKTAFALQVALFKAMMGEKVGIFSLEMSALEITERMLSRESGLNTAKIRTGKFNDDDMTCFNETVNDIYDLDIRICDYQFDISQILNTARRWKLEGLDYLIIDYLQLISIASKNENNENSTLSTISRKIKLLAKELDIPIFLLSQLNRQISEFDEPQLNHLRASGSIEQDADNVFFLYYDKEANLIEDEKKIYISIAKQRSGVRFIKKRLTFKGSRYHFYYDLCK